jgi:hypothetical protein
MPINQPAGGAGGGGSGTTTTVKDEGVNLSTAVVSIDFVGDGVTATGTTAVTVLIPGALPPDVLANRPAAAAAPGGTFYATDELAAYISDGSTWTVLVFDATAIAAGSIGPTELASTAVAAATYGSAIRQAFFTVDADGRLTSATSTSLPWKFPVRAATTGPLTLATDFENADSLDGLTLATGDRVLIKDQAAGAENGVYTINASGPPSRAGDFNVAAEIVGAMVVVRDGTDNGDSVWMLTNNGTITLGTTALVFAPHPDGTELADLPAAGAVVGTDTVPINQAGVVGQAAVDDLLPLARLAGRSGGQTFIGGTASGDDLTLQSTAHATRGTVLVADPVELQPADATFTAVQPVLFMDATYTLDFALIQFGPMIDFAPTLICEQDGNVFFRTNLFWAHPTIKNPTGETRVLAPWTTLADSPIFQGDTTAGNTASHIGVNIFPTFDGINGGTLTGSSSTGFSYNPIVATGATLTTVTGIMLATLAVLGSVGTYVGLDVAPQTDVDITTAIGIRNAASTVLTPTVATLAAAGSTIGHLASVMRLNNTSGGALTLTSTPTMTDGVEGEVVTLFNASANNVVIQDQGTLAGSNLRLSAATITLGTRDSITLMYSSTVGDWIQIGQTNVI